jgi:hypothetical protein
MQNKIIIITSVLVILSVSLIALLLFWNAKSPMFGQPLTNKNLDVTVDPEFPYEVKFIKIKDQAMYLEFFNYSKYNINWWAIDYEYYDENNKFIAKSSYNQSAYPMFLRSKSKTIEILPMQTPKNATHAKVKLVEIKLAE